jgi:hypothetical protein
MNNQRVSQSANRSSSKNYRQWSLDEYDDEPAPRSPPVHRFPISRLSCRTPSLHETQPEPSQMGGRFAGTSWLGTFTEDNPPASSTSASASASPSHCEQANLNAWDMTDQFNSSYYTTGLWDEGCLNPPYCIESNIETVESDVVRTCNQTEVIEETSVYSHEEYEVVEGENKYSIHTGNIQTSCYNSDDEAIYYLKLQDIINYVSRGCSISDEHQESLIEYIKSNVKIDNWFHETRYTVAGTVYRKSMPAIKNHQYTIVAKYCLDWMVSNPEKVSMPGM